MQSKKQLDLSSCDQEETKSTRAEERNPQSLSPTSRGENPQSLSPPNKSEILEESIVDQTYLKKAKSVAVTKQN